MQKKAEIMLEKIQKFFTPLSPLTSFLPQFFSLEVCSDFTFKTHIYPTFDVKKWGKKLLRGVKNFWIVKYDISAFLCTKNYVKKIRNSRKSIYLKIEKKKEKKKFLGQNNEYFPKFHFPQKNFQFFQFSSVSIFASF